MEDLDNRNKILCNLYKSGIPMTEISKNYKISCSQLSRIFRSNNIKRKKFELDKKFFDDNKNKTFRQISEETSIPLKRVIHLHRVVFGKRLTKGCVDFSDKCPEVDPDLINDYNWLYNKYCVEKLGTPTIAKVLGTKASTVIKQLRCFGIELRKIKHANSKNRPSKEWLINNYINKKWSINKCAKEFGTSFNSVYSALRSCNLEIRNASEQHIGELNEFYGKSHDEDTKNICKIIGSYYGSKYWLEGDIELKLKLVSEQNKKIWGNVDRRSEASYKIAKLCSEGKCNSKNNMFICKDGTILLLKSSWEEVIANSLDNNANIEEWKYEHILIEYFDNDVIRNFIVDFYIKWYDGIITLIECKNKHLLSKDKEQKKIEALRNYCGINDYKYLLISEDKCILDIKRGYKSKVKWMSDNLYEAPKSICEDNILHKEYAIHEIINRISPWNDIKYNDEHLRKDVNNMVNENLSGYFNGDYIRSTAPNRNGMPGRKLMLCFNPHFYKVPVKNRRPLYESFNDKNILYKCINISIKEKESLSLERLLREINFHCTNFGRASFFAPGLARIVYKKFGASGKVIFDPCGGWGGRLLGAWLENSKYIACELSELSYNGLVNISKFVNFDCELYNTSCLDYEWPKSDLIFTSPPYYDTEMYIGGDQPWKKFKTRDQWINGFVKPFILKVNSLCILYIDCYTKNDFEKIRKFDDVIVVSNKKHPRGSDNCEFLCIYK